MSFQDCQYWPSCLFPSFIKSAIGKKLTLSMSMSSVMHPLSKPKERQGSLLDTSRKKLTTFIFNLKHGARRVLKGLGFP